MRGDDSFQFTQKSQYFAIGIVMTHGNPDTGRSAQGLKDVAGKIIRFAYVSTNSPGIELGDYFGTGFVFDNDRYHAFTGGIVVATDEKDRFHITKSRQGIIAIDHQLNQVLFMLD